MKACTKPLVFTGAASALVTPFSHGEIDYDALGRLIDWQIAGGIDALVIAGTTGECATLSDAEHRAVLRFAAERCAGRVPLIAGSGSNDTEYALSLSRYACEVGFDAVLLVTPYYNKATPRGLIRSFRTIADAIDRPVLLYDAPGRTGVRIPLAVYEELARHERIAGVKDASGDVAAGAALLSSCGDSLCVYSGNDELTVPLMSLGARGVISVISNLMPRRMHEMCAAALAGNFTAASETALRLNPLMRALFVEPNPIPVKAACAMMGLCSAETRLPLCEPEPEHEELLRRVLREAGLL